MTRFFKKLLEAPIGDWEVSNLDQDFRKTDEKLVKAKHVEDYVRKCFQRFPQTINVFVGKPSSPKPAGTPGVITFILRGNNYDDPTFSPETHPLTGWIISHRFWQGALDDSPRAYRVYQIHENKLILDPIKTALYKLILKTKLPIDPDYLPTAIESRMEAVQSLAFTFRSARELLLTGYDEIMFELLTEYGLRGHIRTVSAEEYIKRYNQRVDLSGIVYRGDGTIVPTPEILSDLEDILEELRTTMSKNVEFLAGEVMKSLVGTTVVSF